MTLPRMRRRLKFAGAAIIAVLAAIPAVASGAATLTLSMEPTVPSKGKPFQIIAQGTAESPSGQSRLAVYFAPGSGPCASTQPLEQASNSNRELITDGYIENGARIDRRGTFRGESFVDYAVKSGLVTGRYRACGYLSDEANHDATLVLARLDFTVGGTCASATARANKAKRALKNAKAQLKKANTSARKKTARKKIKQANKKLKTARKDRKALC